MGGRLAHGIRKAAMALSWISLCLAVVLGAFVTVCHFTHLSCWAFHVEQAPDGVNGSGYFVQLHWTGLYMESDHGFTSSRLARELNRKPPAGSVWDIQWWQGTPTHRVFGPQMPKPTREVHGIPLIWRSVRETHAPTYHDDGSRRSSTMYFDMFIAVWPVQLLLLAVAFPAGRRGWQWAWAKMVRVIRWLSQRPPAGLCPRCGYDLRATPQRCPECGHVVTS